MPDGALAHRCSSQARQTSGTPQGPVVIGVAAPDLGDVRPRRQIELILQTRDLQARAICPYCCQYKPMNTSLWAR